MSSKSESSSTVYADPSAIPFVDRRNYELGAAPGR